MAIDPRWISTPLGAVAGVALAKKLLDKRDETWKNLALGGGVGGGAGFLTGQFIKGRLGDLSTPGGYLEWLRRARPTGAVLREELEALDKIVPMDRSEGLDKAWQQQSIKAYGKSYAGREGHMGRAHALKLLAQKTDSPSEQQKLLDAAEANRSAAESLSTDMTYQSPIAGPKAAWGSIKSIVHMLSR